MRKMKLAAVSLLVVLALTSCRWDLWGTGPMDYGQGLKEPTSTVIFKGEKPEQVRASRAIFADRINVSWNAVPGADYYEVFRAEIRDDNYINPEWEIMPDIAEEAFYEDTLRLDPNKVYMYRVRGRSLTKRDVLGEYSDDLCVGWLLNHPANFTASQGEDKKKIFLSWEPRQGIRGYKIYWRSESASADAWSVAKPKGFEGDEYIIPASATDFDFEPDSKDWGKNIYFRIASVSRTTQKTESIRSAQISGYTYKEGAPGKPRNLDASRGVSPSEITVTWDLMKDTAKDEHFDWEIVRTAPGEKEVRILSTAEDDLNVEDLVVDGRFTVTDRTGVKPGIIYTYSVKAIGTLSDGTKANGLTSTAEGFLFSPPMDITPAQIRKDPEGSEDMGFYFRYRNALGAEDGWVYNVYARRSSDEAWNLIDTVTVNPDPAASYEFFMPYQEGVAGKEYEQFDIRTFNGTMESCGAESALGRELGVPRPREPIGFNASDNKVYPNTSQVQLGKDKVWSMAVTFEKDPGVVEYYIKIGDEVRKYEPEVLEGNTMIIYDVATTGVGEGVWVSIQGVDRLGRKGEFSEPDFGYSAISDETLVRYMQIFGLKPWEYLEHPLLVGYKDRYGGPDLVKKWSSSQIWGKIRQSGTGSLSDGITEKSTAWSIKDDPRWNGNADSYKDHPTGTIHYVAKVAGLGGNITFNYVDFGELPFMATTGFFNMQVSMSGDGSCTGALTIKGWYPASIGFGNIHIGGQAFQGTYSVMQENGTAGSPVSPKQD